MNGVETSFRSKLMPIIVLSVTEYELFPAVMCVQETLFVMRIINSMGSKVKLSMKLDIGKKGAKYITHN